MDLKTRVQNYAREFAADIQQDRQHIHANPELSFEEFETCEYIFQRLESFGIQPEIIGKTGVTALIKGKNPESRILALRADTDALPILEANDVPYKSKKEGVMHACGHDVHTASLLGTARILSQMTDEFEGTIKLIFQPGEERLPGGASILIKEGILENPKPQSIIGQHVLPQLEVGKFGFRSGMYMASTDEIYLTVKGKGGHGAMPETFIDSVLITSHIIVALQQVISRANPRIPAVLSFGKMIAEGATNVIPEKVIVHGTFRTMNEEFRKESHRKMKKIAEGVAESMDGSCDIEIRWGYPFLENEPELTARVREYAVEYIGEENIVDLDLWMAGEDFAFYSHHLPACFYRLGVGNQAKGINSGVHTPTFDIDEEALEHGAGMMTWLALKELTEK